MNGTVNVGVNGATLAAGYCPATVNLLASAFPASNTNSFAITPASSVVVTATPSPVCENTPTVLNAVLSSSSPSLPTGYATSNALYTGDEEILNVSLGAGGSLLNNSSTCSSIGGGAGNGLPGSSNQLYSNYTTTTVPVPNLASNQSIPFSLTLGYCSGYAYSQGYSIFIDLNRNGVFESNEKLLDLQLQLHIQLQVAL